MKTKEIGHIIKKRRNELKLTQKDLSLATSLGTRFISELENGKESCEIAKVLQLIAALGLKIYIHE